MHEVTIWVGMRDGGDKGGVVDVRSSDCRMINGVGFLVVGVF